MKSNPSEQLRSVPASEARDLLAEQRTSGESIAAFARSKGVHPWALYNARAIERRRANRSASTRLAEVRVVDDPSERPPQGAVELGLPSGISIRLTRNFDEVALRRVLGVLSSC